MTDIPMADTGPYRGAGVRANGFGIVIVTIVLTVVGTNVAVGAFLWLALDARLNQFEARVDRLDARMDRLETRMASLESRMASLESRMARLRAELTADIRELRDEARTTNTRLSRMEGALGITGPAAPGAAEP